MGQVRRVGSAQNTAPASEDVISFGTAHPTELADLGTCGQMTKAEVIRDREAKQMRVMSQIENPIEFYRAKCRWF